MMRPRDEEFLKPQDLAISSLLQGVRDAVIVAEASTGRIVYWNPAASEVFGYSPAEALGMNVEELVPGLLGARQWAEISRYRETGHGRYIESPAVPKGGEEIGVELTLSLLELVRDAGVQGKFVLAIVRDDTERKRAEETSRESHALLHSIIEGTAEAIFLKDSQGRYVIVNSACVEIVGKPAEMILGKTDADLYPPEVADSLVEVDRRVMDTGETITLEESLPVAGAMRTYLSTKTPYRDHRGDVAGVIGVSTDITERKRVQEELVDQKILLETTFNQAADALVVCDARGRFTFINPAARRMALMDPEGTTLEVASEVWGTAYSSDGHLIPGEDWPIAKALRGETTIARETRMVRPDGSHYDLLISAAPLMNREGQIVGAVGDCLDITERKKADEQLREAERRYRTLIEQIPAITYVQEPSEPSRTTYISPQMEAVLGYSPQECLSDSEHWIKIMHPADRERVLAEDRRTNETGEPFSMEYRLFAKDGRVVWIRDEASLVRDEEGNPSYWLGVQTDTTEYKRAEERLQEAEARYRSLVEEVPGAIYIQEIEHEGAISYISPQIEGIMGYSPQEYIGHPDLWQRTIHPEDRERVLAEDARTDETGEPFRIEFRKIRRDGRVIWVRDESVLVKTPEGRPLYWQGIFVDVTERKRTERALSESEQRFRQLFEQSVDALFVHDEKGRFVDCNSQACRLLGYSREELLELSVQDVSLDILAEEEERSSRERDEGTLWQRAMMGEPGTFALSHEEENVRKDGTTFPVEVRVGSVEYGGRRMILASVRDITERKKTEEALKQSGDLYRTVIEQAAESVFLVDVETKRILEVNASLARVLGYAPGELQEITLYDVVADDRESVDSNIRRILRQKRYSIGGRKYRRKDGSLVDVEVNVSVVPYGGKETMCIVAHDVTTHKQVEKDLRRSLSILLALREAGEVLSSTLKSEEIVTRLLEIMQGVSGLTAAVISMRPLSAPDNFRIWRSVGLEALWPGVRFAPGAEDARRAALEDQEQRLVHLRRPGVAEDESLEALYLPLKVKDRVVGVMEAYGPESLARIDVAEVLSSLTSQAASALENA